MDILVLLSDITCSSFTQNLVIGSILPEDRKNTKKAIKDTLNYFIEVIENITDKIDSINKVLCVFIMVYFQSEYHRLNRVILLWKMMKT